MRQCSIFGPCFSHSAPQRSHASTQARSWAPANLKSVRVKREMMLPVARHTSAQWMQSRMQWTSSATVFSPRHASAQTLQASAHEEQAVMHSVLTAWSEDGFTGCDWNICL